MSIKIHNLSPSAHIEQESRFKFEESQKRSNMAVSLTASSKVPDQTAAGYKPTNQHIHRHHHHDIAHKGFRNLKFNNLVNMPAGYFKEGKRRRHSEKAELREKMIKSFKRGKFISHVKHNKIVLPSKFLLGGNINDPLNLNSMNNEEINRQLNEKTPASSPLPTPSHRSQVDLVIPLNITDPLNLNSECDAESIMLSPKNKRKKSKSKKKKTDDDELADCEINAEKKKEEKTLSPDKKLRMVQDKIVSPVVPQMPPLKRRKRTVSENLDALLVSSKNIPDTDGALKSHETCPSNKLVSDCLNKESTSITSTNASAIGSQLVRKDAITSKKKFEFGNYNRYYGYRNPELERDDRLSLFKREWFEDKDVLDIGCNVGHLTLSVAKDFKPRKIIGLDIDKSLITAAKKNIRHYASEKEHGVKFPLSCRSFGPISGPPRDGQSTKFPNNIIFVTANYILERNELVDLQKEDCDVILALSITKWVHLNFGDAGLKRMFHRIYRQLRPGGRLILEPQSWASYKKRKKLTDTIWKHFQEIQLKPDQFSKYLLSQVGFSRCYRLETPKHRARGFQRPIFVFIKPDTKQATPLVSMQVADVSSSSLVSSDSGSSVDVSPNNTNQGENFFCTNVNSNDDGQGEAANEQVCGTSGVNGVVRKHQAFNGKVGSVLDLYNPAEHQYSPSIECTISTPCSECNTCSPCNSSCAECQAYSPNCMECQLCSPASARTTPPPESEANNLLRSPVHHPVLTPTYSMENDHAPEKSPSPLH